MATTRLRSGVAASATLLAVLVLSTSPVAASATTSTMHAIRNLSNELLYVAVPVTLATEGVLFYAIWKFTGNDEPTPTSESTRLEVSWTVRPPSSSVDPLD